MLPLFVSISLSVDAAKCIAPISFADPVPNGTLLQVQLLIRHGARSGGDHIGPVSLTGQWLCDDPESFSPRYNPAPVVHPRIYYDSLDTRLTAYPPSCRAKDLLTIGMQQEYELGQSYRNYLVINQSLLPKNYNPNFVQVRSTELDRTLRSAIAFMQGMFPPASPNEVVQITTDTDYAGLLHPSGDWCAELKDQEADFTSSEEYNTTLSGLKAKYAALFSSSGINWSEKTAKKVFSYVDAVACTNHTTLSWMTNDLIEDSIKFTSYYHIGMNNMTKYKGVASSALLREMFRTADELISMQTTNKFVLLSSHDTALAALFPLFDINDIYGPAYRAHLSMELWSVNDDIMVRFVYNGKVVHLTQMSGDLYLYSNVKSEMARLGYLNHCFIPEWK